MSTESLGNRLKKAREAMFLTQTQVAEMLGIGWRTLQDHEAGAHRPGNNTINSYVRLTVNLHMRLVV